MTSRQMWTLYAGLWRRVRTIIVVVFAGLALAYVGLWLADAQGLRAPRRDGSEDFMVALMLIGVSGLATAAGVLLSHSDSERLMLALPDRVLRMPLRTWKLTFIHLAFGVSVAAIVAAAAAVPAPFVLHIKLTWWMAALAMSALIPLTQLWAYAMGNTGLRPALISFILCFGGLAALVQRPWVTDLVRTGSPVKLAVIYIAVLAMIYALACGVVRVQRRGGWTANLPRRAARIVRVKARRPFRSLRATQFWFEWRQYGMLLPVYVGGAAAAYFFGMPLVIGLFRLTNVTGKSSAEPLFRVDWFSSAQYLWMGLFLSAFIGGLMVGAVLFMRGGQWNSNSSYLLTRPLTIARISNARLGVLGLSAALALAELALLTLGIEGLLRWSGGTTGLADFLHQGYDQLPGGLVLVLHFGFLFVLMWACAWPVSYLVVLGTFAVLLLPMHALLMAGALVGAVGPDDVAPRAASYSPMLYWIAAWAAVAGVFVFAGIAYRKRLVHPAVLLLCAVLWIAYSWGFEHSMSRWEVPPNAQDWMTRFPHPINWPLWLGISIVPLLPFFIHPLIMARIRHR